MIILKVFMLLLACIALFTGIISSIIKLIKVCHIPGSEYSLNLEIIVSGIGLFYIILYCTILL